MITFFAIPKPFKGHIGVIQYNAIKSWTLLEPKCEIMLFGDEEGTADIAKEFGISHIPTVERNEFGTPLLSSIFEKAQKVANNDIMCFINSDIILMSDFIVAVNRLRKINDKLLLAGQRYDVDIKDRLNLGINEEDNIRSYAHNNGKLHPQYGIDYFVFTRGMWGEIPPFAIGRPRYDNWLIYKAKSLNIPVIDCTQVILAIHQNHDYQHIQNIDNRFGNGPEVQRNVQLAGGSDHLCTLGDCDLIATKHLLIPKTRKMLSFIKVIKNYYI